MKAVLRDSVLRDTISGMSRASRRSPGMATQINPRAWFIMKAICCGVMLSEAAMTSPSFSRSSSSTTITISPREMASMASSILAMVIFFQAFQGLCRFAAFSRFKKRQISLGRTMQCEARSRAGVLCLVLFHPDYTVGSGLSPDLLTFRLWRPEALAGSGKNPDTAGGELHPALRT
ncbi:Putative secreted protein (modular protein) [Agrobacterium salinitolerans str. Hayward 0363]|nr:Putative secreted protein (modular protein) [Agrobacterium salinitolerans str. Hayward 0363]